jgi:chemotaxis family two-component system sensor kinase Cph1
LLGVDRPGAPAQVTAPGRGVKRRTSVPAGTVEARSSGARGRGPAEILALIPALGFQLFRPSTPPADPADAALFDVAPVGLLVVEPSGRIRRANRAAEAMFGPAPGGLAGRPVLALLGGPGRDRIGHLIAQGTADPPRVVHLAEGLSADGRSFPAELTVAPTGRGSEGWVIAVRDLREREALVRALTERAAQLARSNRDLQQFAYVASHDLQEPLRMVSSYTLLVERRYQGQLGEDANEFLRFAREGAVRMQALIDDLLVYARLETRGQPFVPTPLDAALDEALRNLSQPIGDSGAIIERSPLPTIEADARQIVQLFQNLVGNAIKYRSSATPRIRIGARTEGDRTILSVADNGIGIAPEYHERVFVIFQRLHLREEYEGTGIGLAVCKKVVERHGGRIWVESSGEPGQGSTFFVALPLHQKAPPEWPVPKAPDEATRRAEQIAESLIAERLRELV